MEMETANQQLKSPGFQVYFPALSEMLELANRSDTPSGFQIGEGWELENLVSWMLQLENLCRVLDLKWFVVEPIRNPISQLLQWLRFL